MLPAAEAVADAVVPVADDDGVAAAVMVVAVAVGVAILWNQRQRLLVPVAAAPVADDDAPVDELETRPPLIAPNETVDAL